MGHRKDEKLADDEFDVELLAKKLFKLAVKFLYALSYPVRLLWRKPKLLVLCILLAAGVSFIVKYSLPKIYKGSFIMKPYNKADLFYVNLIYDLQQTIIDQDYEALTRELKIPKELAYKVNQIIVKPIRIGAKSADTIDIAEIEILTSDITLFDTIQNLVMQYIRENEHYSTIEKLRKKSIAGMKKKLHRDLLELDSMKRLLAANLQPRNTGGFVFGEPIDPVGIYEEALNLYKEQVSLDWQEAYIDNFEIIKDCVPTKKPVFPNLYKILMYIEGLTLLLLIGWNYYWVKRK